MLKITDTERLDHYIAVDHIARVVQRSQSSYGAIVSVVLNDGARVETYESAADLHDRIVAEEERVANVRH